MAGLDPAIHVFLSSSKTWMPGIRIRQGFGGFGVRLAEALAKAATRPGMTSSFCQAGLTITRKPSRGFGIGHICQSAL